MENYIKFNCVNHNELLEVSQLKHSTAELIEYAKAYPYANEISAIEHIIDGEIISSISWDEDGQITHIKE